MDSRDIERARRAQRIARKAASRKESPLMFYPIALALNACLLFALAVLWEVVLMPANPIVPIGLIITALLEFFLASEEIKA